MSTLVQLRPVPAVWEAPETRPLDEAVWQAWLLRGRARERRGSAKRLVQVQWISTATLLASAALWSHAGDYATIVRFVVALGAAIVVFHSLHARHYAVAAVFGAMVLLYNPVAPAFNFFGDWQRALVLASTMPFVAALAWGPARSARK